MYELKSRVRYSEVIGGGSLSMKGLFDYLQDSCTMQATEAGVGVEYLVPRHLGWIVTNYQVRIVGGIPVDGDEITIYTTATKFRRMIGYRDFEIQNSKGETMVLATSQWILMDTVELHPASVPEEMLPAYPLSEPLAPDWDIHHKIPDVATELVETLTIPGFVIDTNFHMNNAYYVQIAAGCVGSLDGLKEIFVNYRKAAVKGDVMECFVGRKDDSTVVSMKTPQGEVYCQVEFCF